MRLIARNITPRDEELARRGLDVSLVNWYTEKSAQQTVLLERQRGRKFWDGPVGGILKGLLAVLLGLILISRRLKIAGFVVIALGFVFYLAPNGDKLFEEIRMARGPRSRPPAR